MQEIRGDSLKNATLWTLCLLGSLGAYALMISDIYRSKGISVPFYGVAIGRDFANLWIGGKHVWRGAVDHIYDLPNYLTFTREYFPHQVQHNYSYPPPTLLIGAVFSLLPYLTAYVCWILATGGLFLFAARRYVGGLPLILAVLTPGAIANIWDGQYGFLIGAFWLWLFANIDNSQRKAGIAAGLLTIKPHLGLLIPFILLIRRRFVAIAVALLVALALVAISTAVFGLSPWVDFFSKVPRAQVDVLNSSRDEFYFKMMPTTTIAFHDYPAAIASLFQTITAIAAIAMVWRARSVDGKSLAFISSTATFLILPYAFNYDMTVFCFGIVILLYERWRYAANWELFVLSAGIMLPVIVMAQSAVGLPFAPIILLGCLFIQVRLAVTRANGPDLRL